MTTRRAALLVALTAWLVAVACVDTTPGVYVAVSRDAGAPPSPDSGRTAACTACFEAADGGCHPIYETCARYADCASLFECSLQAGCFEVLDLQARVACAGRCLAQHPVPSGDPLVVLGQINTCVDTDCASACHPQ